MIGDGGIALVSKGVAIYFLRLGLFVVVVTTCILDCGDGLTTTWSQVYSRGWGIV